MDEYTVEQINLLIEAVYAFEDSDQTDAEHIATIIHSYDHVSEILMALARRAVLADATCDRHWPNNKAFKDIERFVTHTSFAAYSAILLRLMRIDQPKRAAYLR